MTDPKDPQAELRKQIYGLSFAVETHPNDFVLRINQKGVDELLKLFQAHQLELLTELLAQRSDTFLAPTYGVPVEVIKQKLKQTNDGGKK